jgi:hypothetical protein
MSQGTLILFSGQPITPYDFRYHWLSSIIACSLLSIDCFAAGLVLLFLQLRSRKLVNRCIGATKYNYEFESTIRSCLSSKILFLALSIIQDM